MPPTTDRPDDQPRAEFESVSDEAALFGYFGGKEPDPYSPLGTAMLWLSAMTNGPDEYRNALERLTVNGTSWDFPKLWADAVSTRTIAQGIENTDNPRVAYAKLVPEPETSVRTVKGGIVDGAWWVTLRHDLDGWWRVAAVTDGSRPSPAEALAL